MLGKQLDMHEQKFYITDNRREDLYGVRVLKNLAPIYNRNSFRRIRFSR